MPRFTGDTTNELANYIGYQVPHNVLHTPEVSQGGVMGTINAFYETARTAARTLVRVDERTNIERTPLDYVLRGRGITSSDYQRLIRAILKGENEARFR